MGPLGCLKVPVARDPCSQGPQGTNRSGGRPLLGGWKNIHFFYGFYQGFYYTDFTQDFTKDFTQDLTIIVGLFEIFKQNLQTNN